MRAHTQSNMLLSFWREDHLQLSTRSAKANIMSYACEICGRHFGNKFNFNRHQASLACQASKNNVNGKLKCADCSALFSSVRNLQKHQERYHRLGSNKAYACGICDLRFKSRNEVLEHRRTEHVVTTDGGFELRASAHKRQTQSWRLEFPSDITLMDDAFRYAW